MSDPIDRPFLEEVEPTVQQQGTDVPGPRGSYQELLNFGIYNGNFRVGPPQSASNLDVATSTTGSNFLPGWRFVQSSNTTISAAIVKRPGNLGSNLRFTVNSLSAGARAYIEQVIDVGGSAIGDVGSFYRFTGGWDGIGARSVYLKTQYLNANGTIEGMPPEEQAGGAATASWNFDHGNEVDPPPDGARFVRVRVEIINVTGSPGYVELYEVRREKAATNLRLVDRSRSTNGLYDVYTSGSNLFWQPSSTTSGATSAKRLLNYQLVAIPFSLVNIPANATTELQLWGDTALGLATPRIGIPYPAAIVGMSYRLSAAPTAGGATALRLQATVAGASVWTAHTLAGSGAAASGESSQSVTADEISLGQQLGVQVVTSSTYAPTTADLAVVLWVAVKFDGA